MELFKRWAGENGMRARQWLVRGNYKLAAYYAREAYHCAQIYYSGAASDHHRSCGLRAKGKQIGGVN